jgi:hypothetical protein
LIPRETGSRLTVAVHSERRGVDSDRKRLAMAHSEGGGVEVDDLRRRRMMVHSEGGGVEVDGLRKRMAMAHSEAVVEAAACSEAGDEAAVCSRARIEDVRRWQHWQQAVVARWFLGWQKSKRERGVKKLLSVVRESVGPEILGWGT